MSQLDLASLKVTTALTTAIKPYSLNPREHPPEQIALLEMSIKRYGFVNPLLVTPEFVLIAGHGRHVAATNLGLREVPVMILAHLSEPEQRGLRVADNSISLKGTWSVENLQTEVTFLFEEKFDLGFDAHALGLFQGELDALINVPSTKLRASAKPRIKASSGPIVSRPHDVWTVGTHVIACADSTDELGYRLVLGDDRADMVLSDQPYNVRVNGHIGGRGSVKHNEFVQGSGEMSRSEFNEFTRKTLALQADHSRPGAINMQFADWRMTGDMTRIAEEIYDQLLNICVWVKRLPAMGSLYRSQHEFVLVLRVKGGKHLNNVQLGRMGRNRSNIWEYASPAGFGAERKNLALHPTCKNVEMLADAIMDVTNHGDIVLDAFLGSGSTALACQKVGRRCRGIELDPRFVDLSVLRLAEATGATPVLSDGTTFDEARARRIEEERG